MERRLAWTHCLCSPHPDPRTGCFPSWEFSPGIPAKSAQEGAPGFWIVSASAADPSLPGWKLLLNLVVSFKPATSADSPALIGVFLLRCAQEQRMYHCELHSFPYLGK